MNRLEREHEEEGRDGGGIEERVLAMVGGEHCGGGGEGGGLIALEAKRRPRIASLANRSLKWAQIDRSITTSAFDSHRRIDAVAFRVRFTEAISFAKKIKAAKKHAGMGPISDILDRRQGKDGP